MNKPKIMSKKRLLLPLIPALAFGVFEVASKASVAAHIATGSPDRGGDSCVNCEMPA